MQAKGAGGQEDEVRQMTARGAVSARAEECAYRKEGCTQECCSPGRRVLEARFVSRTGTGKRRGTEKQHESGPQMKRGHSKE